MSTSLGKVFPRKFYREAGRPINDPLFWADCIADGCGQKVGPFPLLATIQGVKFCDSCAGAIRKAGVRV